MEMGQKGDDAMTDSPDLPDDATLMAYVRGTLPRDKAASVEERVQGSPALQEDVALMRGLVGLRDAETDASPGEFGWSRLSRAIDAEIAAQSQSRPKWRPMLQAAATAICAIGLWQFAVVPNLPGLTGSDDTYIPATGQPAGQVVVAFMPDATESEIRALLQDIGATVIDGPSALGLWTLGFAEESGLDAGVERLRQETAIVESVQAD